MKMYDNKKEFVEKLRERHGWLCVRFRQAMRGNTSQQEANEIEKELALIEQLMDFYDASGKTK